MYMKNIKKILSWISILFLSLGAICLTLAFLLQWNMNEEKIIHYIDENDLSFLMVTKNGDTTNMMEDTKKYLLSIGIPNEAILSVINSEPTKKFVGKYTYQIFKQIIYQTGHLEITKDDIVALVKDNFPIISFSLNKQGLTFQKQQQDKILNLIDKHSDNVLDLFPTVNQFIHKMEQELLYNQSVSKFVFIINTITSKKVIIVLLIFLFFNVFFLFLLNWKQKVSIVYFRTSILFYSFFFIGIEVFLGTIVKDFLMNEWKSANRLFNYLVNVISKNLWIFILLGLFLAVFLTRILTKWKEKDLEK